MSYKVFLETWARGEFRDLPRQIETRLRESIDDLAERYRALLHFLPGRGFC